MGTAKGDQDSPFLSHLQGEGEKIPSNNVRDFCLQSDTLLTPKEWSGEGHILSSQGSSCELGIDSAPVLFMAVLKYYLFDANCG